MNWLTRNIIDPTPDTLGVDVSDLSLKVAHMHNGRVVQCLSAPLPQGAVVDGNIVDAAIVATILQRLCKGVAVKHVVCSLPEVKAFVRIIHLPPMPEEEIAEAVKWEMGNHIPMALEQVHYDWQLLRDPAFAVDKQRTTNVLVVAVGRVVVENMVTVIEQAGLRVVACEIESIAQARSLGLSQDKATAMVVDIGDRRTSFVMLVAGVPIFTSSVPLSGENITEAISRGLGISKKNAEKAKRAYGIGLALKDDHLFLSVKPIIENLTTEVERSLEFYKTNFQYPCSIEKIVLCGGGGLTQGLDTYLQERLAVRVVLGDPIQTTHSTDEEAAQQQKEVYLQGTSSVQYTTAIGLGQKKL